MRILLIGEFSNVHATLSESLRKAGHEVLLVSDGDDWKGYKRDVSIRRRCRGNAGTLDLLAQWAIQLPKLKGFDIVHFVNPKFTDMNPAVDKYLFSWLSRHNKHVTLGLYGDDTVVISQLERGILEYSELQAYGKKINIEEQKQRIHAWTTACKPLCDYAVSRAELLFPCLYEYYHLYKSLNDSVIDHKLHYVGLPITLSSHSPKEPTDKVRILIGIQKTRSNTKGTDKMLPLFDRLAEQYPDEIELIKVENVPFLEYKRLLSSCDILVDQLYSYTPAMNALEAMSHGTVVVTGGEEDYYRFIGEEDLRPIINLRPLKDEENYKTIEQIALNRTFLSQKKAESIAFVAKYHNADNIAKEYLNLWQSLL